MLSITKYQKNGGAVMKKSLFAAILMVLVGGFLASSVTADDTLVRFQGAIGDIPVANVAGAVKPHRTLPDVGPDNFRGGGPPGRNCVIFALRTVLESERG